MTLPPPTGSAPDDKGQATGETGALIARLEAAERGSRELDAEIVVRLLAPEGATAAVSRFNGEWCVYLGERNGEPKLWEPHGKDGMLKRLSFTTSLDAALALDERVLPGWGFYLRSDKDGHGVGLSYPDYSRVTPGHVEHRHSLPLALCVAILRATGEPR